MIGSCTLLVSRGRGSGHGMKGLIFNLLEDAITRDLGEGAWDRVLETAQLAGVYYGERVALAQTECLHRGDARCAFERSFSREAA